MWLLHVIVDLMFNVRVSKLKIVGFCLASSHIQTIFQFYRVAVLVLDDPCLFFLTLSKFDRSLFDDEFISTMLYNCDSF